MVMKSSAVGSMHILMRRSSTLSTSQALAWQTTSRSRGLVNSDRSQNVWRQRRKAERHEEALAVARHLPLVDLPALQDLGQVEARIGVGRRDQRVDVLPGLRPHVAEQVRGNRARSPAPRYPRTSRAGGCARRRAAKDTAA